MKLAVYVLNDDYYPPDDPLPVFGEHASDRPYPDIMAEVANTVRSIEEDPTIPWGMIGGTDNEFNVGDKHFKIAEYKERVED